MEKILDKIKKCLALSQSPEPHEAAAAMRQAQKLMEMHNISAADLSRAEIGEAKIRSKVSVSRVKDWELQLLNLVARAFGCKLMWMKSNSHAANVYGQYTIIGLKGQVELAHYTADVMGRKLMGSRTKFINNLPGYLSRRAKTAEADGFCHGYVEAISKTVHDFALSKDQDDLLSNYVNERSSGQASTRRSNIGHNGYVAGREAGAGESIHRPVNGRANVARLTN